MHGKGISMVGNELIKVGNTLGQSGIEGLSKTRETLDTVFKIPTFYYHHGKKLR